MTRIEAVIEVINRLNSGKLVRDNDEKGAKGFWDIAADLANSDPNELQENIYNALYEVYEATNKKITLDDDENNQQVEVQVTATEYMNSQRDFIDGNISALADLVSDKTGFCVLSIDEIKQ